MGPDETNLRKRLRGSGLATALVDAAWPQWWTDAAGESASARNELRFVLARALGLDPRALIDGDQVRFAATVGPRFKALSAADVAEQHAIASFGQSIARLLSAATVPEPAPRVSAARMRAFMLDHGIVPSFQSITAICWQFGIPVAYLDITPLEAKRMHAMAAGRGMRCAILVAFRDSLYAKAAFTIAHELGHIMLGHLDEEAAYLDVEDPMSGTDRSPAEDEANRYALELLTGRPEPVITTSTDDYNAQQLARAAADAGAIEGVDPATIALCDGFRTGDWARSTAACLRIQGRPANVAVEANGYAERQLDMEKLGEDSRVYLRRVLGLDDD
ncbi:ImmA/IrrE family metallo-endopeptidase [Sphingomonas sp. AR_OL41]|uniref:ImmA/IrrE family metallo-endopeptidase n=1 Tax=Sphingomonas sp. AR_OL41 TaxID=3042729 RepID=UPI002480E4E3|nr:ImmA/IrrE family metallo-endopeptidase [Sphingomonas sp. AR_OL41]MDH7972521.1 ImmA/IrrE family metallo-endopeptidase [Sphingomonas sp. AR_OL41]